MKEGKNNDAGWLALTHSQKIKIEMGLRQLKEGKGISVKKAMVQLTKKYNLS